MASNNKVLTIDITNESITITEVTASEKKTSTVHNAIIFETPEDAYEDGFIRDKEELQRRSNHSLLQTESLTRTQYSFLPLQRSLTERFLYLSLRKTKLKELLMRTHQSISLLI